MASNDKQGWVYILNMLPLREALSLSLDLVDSASISLRFPCLS